MVDAPACRRLGFIDAARTLAMALMVQGHVCDNLLSPAGKASWFYQHYLPIRGLTAPLFFFISGFSFVIASDPAWEEYKRPGPRLWRRVRRAGTLLLVGWFLQVPRWSGPAYTHTEWRYLFRSGVLHSVAAGLLLALLVLAFTRTRRSFAVWTATFALASVAAGALASASHEDMPNLGLFLRTQEGSLFPVVPWMAHFLLGASVARLHLDTELLGPPRRLAAVVGLAGLVLLGLGQIWLALDPADLNLLKVWVSDPGVFLSRAGRAWIVFAAFLLVLRGVPSTPLLQRLASHALSIYVVHLVALYGWPGMDGLVQRVGSTLGVGRAFQVGPLLFLACAAVVVGFSFVLEALQRLARTACSRLFPAPGSPS